MASLVVSSQLPLYQQLLEDIKADINDGKYSTGDKIPSELELADVYGVSRITVRRAVAELCNEGYLVKRQGKGTFVDLPKINRKIPQDAKVLSFSKACDMSGMKPGAKTLFTEICPARLDECKFFGLSKDSNVVYLQRVHTADGDPLLLENNFLPCPEFAGLVDEDLTDKSLFEVLHKKYKRSPVARDGISIEVSRASHELAKILNVSLGDPLFYITVHFLDEKGAPICIGRQYFVASRFVFNF